MRCDIHRAASGLSLFQRSKAFEESADLVELGIGYQLYGRLFSTRRAMLAHLVSRCAGYYANAAQS